MCDQGEVSSQNSSDYKEQRPTPRPNLPKIEESVLAFWSSDKTFEASLEQRQHGKRWVFYDGPPFANGLPHFGHLLTGYIKDAIPRYQTMRGQYVPRVFGWDTHGLPAELEAMKRLGITEKSQIESMGIASFNEAARKSVLTYVDQWEEYVNRQARWVDFKNGYKTLDLDYMESVLWAFKTLYKKGVIYEGYKVLPYCWNDQTPLSNHELRMDDEVYKQRLDDSLTVTFPLIGQKAKTCGLDGVAALAWTTTPWTLPSNMALIVSPNVEYVVVSSARQNSNSDFLLCKSSLDSYAECLGYESGQDARASIRRTLLGKEIEGIHYKPLFDYYADLHNAFTILSDNYVDVTEGTGIVHASPAHGEDDKRVCDAFGVPTVVSINDAACFTDVISDYAGMHIFDANAVIRSDLSRDGRILRHESYKHSYPHCWRCRSPLIYKAVTSWFFRITDSVNRMLELNQQINWVPKSVKNGQFAKWLSSAKDWSISRTRYWGTPIPVWKSDNPEYPRIDCYGSLKELEDDFGIKLTDLHRPEIDRLTRPNPDDPTGASTMRRVPDVLDVWFDAASMPFAQLHYPFENIERFEANKSADFIVEYAGQIRGWFYLLHAMSTALFDGVAFKNAICHGIVLGDDGQKASKSLRNYPDVYDVFENEGSDAVRWYLISSSILRGGSLIVSRKKIQDAIRQYITPLWSSWYFFHIYSEAARPGGYKARFSVDSQDILDRYILSKTGLLVEDVTRFMDSFDMASAALQLRDFVAVLTNWYIRRSRDRFWDGSDTGAFDTLYTVLETLCRLGAVFVPMVSEHVYKCLTNSRSVHLSDWPDVATFPNETGLVETMDRVRKICSTGLSLRKRLGIKARQPLSSAHIRVAQVGSLAQYKDIISGELNVKTVSIEEGSCTQRMLKILPRVAGPRLAGDVQTVIAAARRGDWTDHDGHVTAGGIPLLENEYQLVAGAQDSKNSQPLPFGGSVTLDTRIDETLRSEGVARDTVRQIQIARKEKDLNITDRISLEVCVPDEQVKNNLLAFSELICKETLCDRLDILVKKGIDGITVSLEKFRQ
ncbi:isoleucine--tRNA ligase [Tropheryma whipplei]|uniref:isoleucine--tRNA ligase n=1 Tax=Tropheryma whipplei TaxID=2039 RepID=UPI00056E4CB8